MPMTTQTMKSGNVQQQQYYNVDVYGDYFVNTADGNVVRPFGVVTLKMYSWQKCQSLARFHLIPALLAKVDQEFREVRRCIVTGVRTMNGSFVQGLPIKFMSKEQIALECRDQGFPIVTDMYPDITTLRSKLRMARNDPDKFKKQEQKAIKAFSRIGDAIDLNKDVFADILNANAPDLSKSPPQEQPADTSAEPQPVDTSATEAGTASQKTMSTAQLKEQVHADETKETIVSTGGVDVAVTGGTVNDGTEFDDGDFEL